MKDIPFYLRYNELYKTARLAFPEFQEEETIFQVVGYLKTFEKVLRFKLALAVVLIIPAVIATFISWRFWFDETAIMPSVVLILFLVFFFLIHLLIMVDSIFKMKLISVFISQWTTVSKKPKPEIVKEMLNI